MSRSPSALQKPLVRVRQALVVFYGLTVFLLGTFLIDHWEWLVYTYMVFRGLGVLLALCLGMESCWTAIRPVLRSFAKIIAVWLVAIVLISVVWIISFGMATHIGQLWWLLVIYTAYPFKGMIIAVTVGSLVRYIGIPQWCRF